MFDHDELAALLDSWVIQLRADRKSPETIDVYRSGVRQYLAWCQATGTPPGLDPRSVAAWIVSLLDAGRAPKTASTRQGAVRQFSAWLAAEDEIDRDLLIGVKPPKVPEALVDALTDEQLRAMLAACKGKDLVDRRDDAIVRLMAETGARCNEVLAMNVPDVDVSRGLAAIRHGKGGKARTVPFGPATGASIDRYLRARRRSRYADSPHMWVGRGTPRLGYDALYRTLRLRAKAAGIERFHPHMLRHTFAKRWLAANGSEGGVMAIAGWSRREMLDRYVASARADLAADEARSLGLGDM